MRQCREPDVPLTEYPVPGTRPPVPGPPVYSSPIRMRLAALLTALLVLPQAASPRPTLDAQDRAAFLAWFTLLADAQFYRPTADVDD